MIESLKNFLKMIVPTSITADSAADPNCRTINGSFQAEQCTIDEKLKINGAAILGQNTIIKKTITINGQLKATGVFFEDNLFANGTTDISNSSLKLNAYFSGNLIAQDCQFSNSIILLSLDSSFSHCQINHVIIQRLPHVKTPQKIRLSNGCEITGDVTFEAGNGEIWIEKSTQIHGKVIGGKIFST